MGQSIDVGVRVVFWCFGELRDDLSFWQAWAGGLAGTRHSRSATFPVPQLFMM